MSANLEQTARRQLLWRFVNDRVHDLEQRRARAGVIDFGRPFWARCECGRRECTEMLELGGDDYDAIRSKPTTFVVVAGHEIEELERPVEDRGRFRIVEAFGPAAELAVAANV